MVVRLQVDGLVVYVGDRVGRRIPPAEEGGGVPHWLSLFPDKKRIFPRPPLVLPTDTLPFQSLRYVMKRAAAYMICPPSVLGQGLQVCQISSYLDGGKERGVWRKRDFVGKNEKLLGGDVSWGEGGGLQPFADPVVRSASAPRPHGSAAPDTSRHGLAAAASFKPSAESADIYDSYPSESPDHR